MKAGDLVRFDREVVSNLLSDEEPNNDWLRWIGLVLVIENEDFCQVIWHDGYMRQEFIENLAVISAIAHANKIKV